MDRAYKLLERFLVIFGGIATVFSCVIAFIALASPHKASQVVVQLFSGETPTPVVVIATPAILPTPTPAPSPTRYPTHTPYPTYTPYPTQRPPTATPRPTAIPGPTATPRNTGLKVGEWYSQGDISSAITEVRLGKWGYDPTLSFDMLMKNISEHTISFKWESSNFRLEDNLGNLYVCGEDLSERLILEPGEQASRGSLFIIDHSDPRITEVTLIVTNLSDIEHAEWVIPLYH